MKRRQFLQTSALASGAAMVPMFLKPFESIGATKDFNGKSIVIIQLSGGNDGLNTIVPYKNDEYYYSRPTIAVRPIETLRLNDELGLNPSLAALRGFYDDGQMAILNSVGYPNPDRSHFRSMDIWHTASDANEYLTTGWLGRFLDSNCSSENMPYDAIELDDTLSLAMKGKEVKGIAMRDAKQLYNSTREPYFKQVLEAHKNSAHQHEHENVDYLYKTMIETYSSAEYIHETSKIYKTKENFPNNQFGKHLQSIASMINSGLKTKVYYVSHGSFDTHVFQKNNHNRLLKVYADGVAAFMNELKRNDKLDDVVIMTFSEFGRRVKQNASGGTDHGAANNVFLMGGGLKKPGIYNSAPDLLDLDDNGDIKYKIDFRQVYSTLLDKWLCAGSGGILHKSFEPLDLI